MNNGIQSAEIPTDEHSQAYHVDFYQRVHNELSKKDSKILSRYIGRVRKKEIESGTEVEDAFEAQIEYEEEKEKARVIAHKVKYENDMKSYSEKLVKFKADVENEFEKPEYKNKKAFNKFIKDNLKVTTALSQLKSKSCYKCYKYEVKYKINVMNNLNGTKVDVAYYDKNGSIDLKGKNT